MNQNPFELFADVADENSSTDPNRSPVPEEDAAIREGIRERIAEPVELHPINITPQFWQQGREQAVFKLAESQYVRITNKGFSSADKLIRREVRAVAHLDEVEEGTDVDVIKLSRRRRKLKKLLYLKLSKKLFMPKESDKICTLEYLKLCNDQAVVQLAPEDDMPVTMIAKLPSTALYALITYMYKKAGGTKRLGMDVTHLPNKHYLKCMLKKCYPTFLGFTHPLQNVRDSDAQMRVLTEMTESLLCLIQNNANLPYDGIQHDFIINAVRLDDRCYELALKNILLLYQYLPRLLRAKQAVRNLGESLKLLLDVTGREIFSVSGVETILDAALNPIEELTRSNVN